MSPGVDEEREDVEVFAEGARPPVGEDQRQWVGTATPFTDDMDALSIYHDDELVEIIEPGLEGSEVERVPIRDE